VRAPLRAVALTLALSLAALLLSPAPPALAAAVVRNPGEPSYVVHLRTGAGGRLWRGDEQISFRNLDVAPLPLIWIRLWSNGVLGCGAHSIAISSLNGGTAGAATLACTAVPVTLDTPVAPGAAGSISMHLVIHIPLRNDRFGYHGGISLLGTALPTLAVSDDAGWHLDPFVDLGESFYSVVGSYRVTLDTPKGLQTPTTGTRVAHRSTPAGRSISEFRATNVRDFEWAAGHLDELHGASGSTRVHVWYSPTVTTLAQARSSLAAAARSMNKFSRSFGTYPYREADVVLTSFRTFGGMEYPTIVFTIPDPITISHELAHQWWYAIVGDDQYREPWLDEGFATWSERLPFSPWGNCSSYPWPSPTARVTNDMTYWGNHPSEYDTIYGGGGCLLAALAHLFGLPRFVRILHKYAADEWLGNARTADFKAIIDSNAARDLTGFDPVTFWANWRVD
jgi:hypothetical protein